MVGEGEGGRGKRERGEKEMGRVERGREETKRGREREGGKWGERVSKWCFTPIQPVLLYQGDTHFVIIYYF